MKVYVVWADTYNNSWGCEVSLFGVYDSEEKARAAIKELNNERRLDYIIEELTINEREKVYLDGYYE